MGHKKSEWEYLLLVGVVLLSVLIATPKVFSATAVEYGQIAALQNVIILNNIGILGQSLDKKFDSVAQSVPAAGAPVNPELPADNEAPQISFISPDISQPVKGNVSIQLDATDNVGVEQIEISLPSGETAYPMKRIPYTWNWLSSDVADGEYTIIARVKDKAGNSNQAELRIRVQNKEPDTTPPQVQVLLPRDGEELQGEVSLRAEITDESPQTRTTVEIMVDGSARMLEHDLQNGSVGRWNSLDVPNGEYTIVFTAYDMAGNMQKAQVRVNVRNEEVR